MITPISLIWRKLGSIHLTVVLCLMLTADLAWGYFCLNRNALLFAPLNEVGLVSWSATYGRQNLEHTAWIFILMGLLTALCINTFVCTTDRVTLLVRMRDRLPIMRLLFKFAPHVMHYAVIVILAGYLGSYLFARVLDTRTLVPGSTMQLPGTTAQVTFESSDPRYYRGDKLPAFENRVLQPRARLILTDGGKEKTAMLNYNQPVRFKGYGIFLKDYSPKKKSGGMSTRVRINMGIRKDPGVAFYTFGMILFTAGLFMYLAEWVFVKKADRKGIDNDTQG